MDLLNTTEYERYLHTVTVRYHHFMRVLKVFKKSELPYEAVDVVRAWKEKQIDTWHAYTYRNRLPRLIDNLYANVITAAFKDFERKYRNGKND